MAFSTPNIADSGRMRGDEEEKLFKAINFDPATDDTLALGTDANAIHDFYDTSDWITEEDEGSRGKVLVLSDESFYFFDESFLTGQFRR